MSSVWLYIFFQWLFNISEVLKTSSIHVGIFFVNDGFWCRELDLIKRDNSSHYDNLNKLKRFDKKDNSI